eukprot:CAMPEP_0177618104 /NCGR_PEP_ID=MMETSP0419_2-20121207/25349_1 /TAXON_ID=582737 /ORGANISM="Tetraselmis sp., Strain GSL018" /LENGTH=96 /DNA_ID=CAMNT_0019116883 /DNA_START=226 /DNA_END=513 /DNA_ORIENTATION=+
MEPALETSSPGRNTAVTVLEACKPAITSPSYLPKEGWTRSSSESTVHVFASEAVALSHLRAFGDLDVCCRAVNILGYAALSDVAVMLLATRVRPAV